MYDLQLALLGKFHAAFGQGALPPLRTSKVQALLIYLVVEAFPGEIISNNSAVTHRREALMELLWPAMPLKSAQGNLRQTLYQLRKAIPDQHSGGSPVHFIDSDRLSIGINPAYEVRLDTAEFSSHLRAGRLETAVALYRGDFLTGFYLTDSSEYEAWAQLQRNKYRQQALDALDSLTGEAMQQGHYDRVLQFAWRQLAIDDLRERACRQVMEAEALLGQREAAIAQYERCRQRLAEELGVEPSLETEILLTQIQRDEIRVAQEGVMPRQPHPAAERESAPPNLTLPVEQPTARPVPRGNLPARTKQLIGREAELLQLDYLFAVPDRRLVTIFGPGGMGKTHLAIEWARGQTYAGHAGQPRYPDGVYFIDLTPIENLAQIAPAMADRFAYPLHSERRSSEEQIRDYLREKKLLLILDNFEHIMEACAFVNDILRAAPGVDILVTSREHLHLISEQIYAIEGLAYPPTPLPGQPADTRELETYPAVQLFIESARRIRPDYQLRAEDREPVSRICRCTAGIPLALELAAAWTELMPLRRIAGEIEHHFDLLERVVYDLPERHRSIRAVIDSTWNLLQPPEQQIFAMLSLFRGGFTWEAVTAVWDEQPGESILPRTLYALHDKALLVYDPHSERFTIHELLRQYGAEKLDIAAQNSPENDPRAARKRHAYYYARVLRECETRLKGALYAKTLCQIDPDLENILTAWTWLVDNECRPQLLLAMDSLGLFLEIRGHLSTGRRNFRYLASCCQEQMANHADDPAEIARDLPFLARTLAWQSAFELDRHEAEALLVESLTLLDDSRLGTDQSRAPQAFVYYRLGQTLHDSQMARATEYLTQSLALYQVLDDSWGIGYCLQRLGFATLFINLAKSQRYLIQAADVFEKSGDSRGLGQTLNWLTNVSTLLGDHETMEKVSKQCLDLLAGLEQPVPTEDFFHINAVICEARGQYAQAAGYREQLVAYFADLGRARLVQKVYLAYIYLHADQFQQGRDLLQQTWRELEGTAVEHDYRLAFCRHVLASLALAEDEFAVAQEHLQKTMTTYENNKNTMDMAGVHALTGIALIAQGKMAAARCHLLAGLESALDHKGVIPLGETLLGFALLLAHQGQTIQARRLYELAWRQPRFQYSALYDGIAGREIRALTAAIPPADLDVITREIAACDHWQEAASLRDQLRENKQQFAIS